MEISAPSGKYSSKRIKRTKPTQRLNQSIRRRKSNSTSIVSSSLTLKNYSTEGYNFIFNFDAKNALNILTKDKNYISSELMYDPSSPTQSNNESLIPEDAMDVDRQNIIKTVTFN